MSVQSTPIEITVKEIERGIRDGSIRAGVKPQMILSQCMGSSDWIHEIE